MTQEILGYLLIRSHLLVSDVETMIGTVEKHGSAYFKRLIHSIADIMRKEDFVLMYPDVEAKIDTLLLKYRFDYNKDKELNDDMNFIIGRRNEYRNMTIQERVKLRKKFCNQECEKRSLTKSLAYPTNIRKLISLDGDIFARFILGEDQENTKKLELELPFIVSYLSVINILVNTEADYFIDSELIDLSLANIDKITDIIKDVGSKHKYSRLRRIFLEYTRKTASNIKSLEKKYPIKTKKITIEEIS